jgi:hypothetical protein
MSHTIASRSNGLRRRRLYWRSSLACGPLLVALCGCGSSQPADRVPVFPAAGKVSFDGRPLTGAFVVLHPKAAADGKTAPRPHAQAAADGSYTLTSYEANDGAPAGDYTVTIELRPIVKNGGDYAPGPNVLPARYSRETSSPLTVQIAAGSNTLPDLQITK